MESPAMGGNDRLALRLVPGAMNSPSGTLMDRPLAEIKAWLNPPKRKRAYCCIHGPSAWTVKPILKKL
jgi:hypothetical protein